ncbi:1-aminocyclopropane-1-carboxylate oxidase-like 3, partial [Mucuna pruriens]
MGSSRNETLYAKGLEFVSKAVVLTIYHEFRSYRPKWYQSLTIFQSGDIDSISKVFGPIKELLSEDHPSAYREISLKDYMAHRYASGSGTSALLHFKL